jgi:uncharacterized protein (TIGR02217 family)
MIIADTTEIFPRPLYRYATVPLGQQPADEIQQVLYFWHAVGGRTTCFRFRDWADYKSCQVQDDPLPTDQPLVYDATQSPAGYRLVKRYDFGVLSQMREIHKPEGATIRVANELGVEQDAADWTVDEATGMLYPGGGFAGTPTSWGGQFYVYVRFDSELDIEITENQIQSCTFSLLERRIPQS